MTEAEINQAVAEALGRWLNYYRDLNACAEMEKWITSYDLRGFKYDVALLNVVKCFEGGPPNYMRCWHATAPQHCEAFLKTIGKWKE